jgi:phosphate starvation-inducible protein PhoH and related proteins
MSRKRVSAVRDQDIPFLQDQRKNQKSFYLKESKTIDFSQVQKAKAPKRAVALVPKSINQEKYIIALLDQDTDIVVVSGPAGTGKTYLAILAAIKALRARECNRIILTRPKVSVDDEDHGHLPGDLNAKLAPWMRPMVDILHEYYSMKELEEMLQEQIIEFSPLGYMRGRTFKDSFIILDEGQNAKPAHMKMLMTRIGEGSKIVITGDTEQADQRNAENGLLDLANKLKKTPMHGMTACEFEAKDIQRHRIIEAVLNLYR